MSSLSWLGKTLCPPDCLVKSDIKVPSCAAIFRLRIVVLRCVRACEVFCGLHVAHVCITCPVRGENGPVHVGKEDKQVKQHYYSMQPHYRLTKVNNVTIPAKGSHITFRHVIVHHTLPYCLEQAPMGIHSSSTKNWG